MTLNNIRFDKSKYAMRDYGFAKFRRNSVVLTGFALWWIADMYRDGMELMSYIAFSHEEIHAVLRKIGENAAANLLDNLMLSALSLVTLSGFEESVCGLSMENGKLLVPRRI